MGRHVDKIVMQELLAEGKQAPKEIKIEKQKTFKELSDKVAKLEEVVNDLAKLLQSKKEQKKDENQKKGNEEKGE